MTPVEIIEQAKMEGVNLALSPAGTITATGAQLAVDSWLPAIRQSKAEILAELQRENRLKKVLAMLRDNPGIRYAVEVINPDTDPVIVPVAIRNVSTFELKIPQAYYDPFTLLELIQQQAGDEYANT